ncbi:dTDP-4-dehydrorhamnose 3,5-epimerase [Nisaea sediminum]|uniref:dTDP-4-dehydrorhamnose 3,5-epimerase n=1 Tax=Nisaea sediminum TaxID=2775867 RepID=UPI0029C06BFF|nr:dTDP-4-dehydrorhamnose 3,5-epimerase [Nisaea sediminum]
MSVTFEATNIPGAWIVDTTAFVDERGAFSRTFSHAEFAEQGLETCWRQISSSSNRNRGTLRGPHFQRGTFSETKLVRCERGRIFDVVVDLRTTSPAFGAHFAIELSVDNRLSVYAPRGCAHGFMTLEDDSTINYHISADFNPDASSGVLWCDEEIGIEWPFPPIMISEKDRNLPRFAELRKLGAADMLPAF